MHTQPSCTMSSISAIVRLAQNTNKTLTACVDEVAVLRRRLSSPKCCLFKYFVDGGNRSPCHPPFYRHQQVIPGHAAAEGEPDGTSAARSGGWEHNKAQFFTMGARRSCSAKKHDCQRKFAYLREDLDYVKYKQSRSTLVIEYSSLLSVASAK